MTATRVVRRKVLMYVDEQLLGEARDLVQAAWGRYPPPPIVALLDAMSRAKRAGRTPGPRRYGFDQLLHVPSPITVTAGTPDQRRTAAHSWARYHDCEVATRQDPNGATLVWLVARGR